jgi:hypothetical protein
MQAYIDVALPAWPEWLHRRYARCARPVDQLGLVVTVDRFGEGVVIVWCLELPVLT